MWYITTNMKAKLLMHTKDNFEDGSIIEIKIWSVAKNLDKPFGLKYSLVFIEKNQRIIGYDNSEQKIDHRHYKNFEEPYNFKDIETLITDFRNDIKRYKNES